VRGGAVCRTGLACKAYYIDQEPDRAGDILEVENNMQPSDNDTRIALEAAAFRRLVAHLQKRSDTQNIDLMNLAGFCRNCLSKWYRAEAEGKGIEMSDDEARELIYGMPYGEWKDKYQTDASPEKLAAYEINKPKD